MIIRPATLADSEGLARVQISSYRTAYASFFPATYFDHFTLTEQTEEWQSIITLQTNEVLSVAEDGQGVIIGYALGKPIVDAQDDYEGDYESELVALHVLPSHQRRGIGRQLMAAVATGLQKQGCSSIMLWTLAGNPIRFWYIRLGGVPCGEKRSMADDVEVVSVAFGWPDTQQLFLP